MRAFISATAIGLLLACPATAQKSARTLASPAPSGPTIDKALYRILTVTYPAASQGKMFLSTPAGSFTCTPPSGFPVGLPSITCKAKVKHLPLALEATWLLQNGPYAQTGNGKPITGKQWGGDCAGTAGASCLLDMSSDRTVTINPNIKESAQ